MSEDNESIFIPLRSHDEAVVLYSDILPDNVQEIIDLLRYEEVKLDIWLQIAVTYYKNQKFDQFLKILNNAATQHFGDNFDKIAILDSIAAYYIELAKNTNEKSQKHKYYEEANNFFSKADRINIREEITWVGKGVLSLQKGDYVKAFRDFETAVLGFKDCIPALLGKAVILYQQRRNTQQVDNRGSYREALNHYKRALENNPHCPPCVRNGIAICYYQLGKVELARKWFERVLELDPNNIDAIVSIAILEMNVGAPGCIKKAYQIISKVYQVRPNHSRVLNLLANYYFHRNDFNQAESFALKALNSTTVTKIQAESNYIIARNYQIQNDFDYAYEYYQKAVGLWPDYPLALFGLAQMYIYKDQIPKAQKLLEKVLELYPNNVETLKILASLYIGTSNEDLSKQYLRKVLEKHPNDWSTWVELARICEKTDSKTALSSFEKAANILGLDLNPARKNEFNVGLEIWNNIGVLRMKLEDYKGAEIAFLKAIDCGGSDSLMNFLPVNITPTYNLARLFEEINRFKEAEVLYLGILKEHPNYLDCYLRLASISKETGQYSDAIGWIQFSFMINKNHIDSWTMLGALHLHKLEWAPAQLKFEQILKNLDKNDPYSLLALGNIYYNAKFEKKEKADRYFQLAMDFYWKVLQTHPNNVYAANGLGIIMAEKRKLSEAKDFFMKVRESTSNFPDVWVNLAHVFILQGQFSNAISLYSKALNKFYYGQNGNVLLYLAYSYYLNKEFSNAKKTLVKALHLFPNNLNSWYNLAVSLKANANLAITKNQPVYEELFEASNDIDKAIELLVTLNERAKDIRVKRSYSSNHCLYLAKKLEGMKEKCLELLDDLEKQKKESDLQKRLQLEHAEKLREKTMQDIEKRKQKEKEKQMKLAELARRNEEMLLSMQQKWSFEDESVRKRSNKKASSESPEASSSEDEPENEPELGDDDNNDNNGNDNNDDDNNNVNGSRRVDEYGSNNTNDFGAMRRRNASHLEALVAEAKGEAPPRTHHDEDKMEEDAPPVDNINVGFDEELIREALENPENTSWFKLKEALIEKGVSLDILSTKRKLILKKARIIKKNKK